MIFDLIQRSSGLEDILRGQLEEARIRSEVLSFAVRRNQPTPCSDTGAARDPVRRYIRYVEGVDTEFEILLSVS